MMRWETHQAGNRAVQTVRHHQSWDSPDECCLGIRRLCLASNQRPFHFIVFGHLTSIQSSQSRGTCGTSRAKIPATRTNSRVPKSKLGGKCCWDTCIGATRQAVCVLGRIECCSGNFVPLFLTTSVPHLQHRTSTVFFGQRKSIDADVSEIASQHLGQITKMINAN